jgi:DNA-binding winged helix-turn-helix (wHTH) protein
MTIYEVGPFQLHAQRRALLYRGTAPPIGAKAVETLLALVESGGEVVSKERLMERLWPDRFVEESNLTQNVYVLRKLFQRYGGADPIETHAGVGYRLAIPSRPVAVRPATSRKSNLPARLTRFAVAAAALSCVLVIFGVEHTGGDRAMPSALSDEGARLYAIGRYYWNLRSPRGVALSMRYFSAVIDRDPQSPLGYLAMADANVSMGDYCYGIHRPSVYFARARAYVGQALELDSQSAPAHATSGFVALHERHRTLALSELRRAIALDPNYAPAHQWYGIALARERRFAEGTLQLREAARLDPLSVVTMRWLSRLAYRDAKLREAIAYRDEAAQISPDLARRTHPSGHPEWASIEGKVALGPTEKAPAAYARHESSVRSALSDGHRGAGGRVYPDAPNSNKE